MAVNIEGNTEGVAEPPVIPDISVYEAKIEAQNVIIAERDAANAKLSKDLSDSKAANYDLLMSIPKDATTVVEVQQVEDNTMLDFDDLFEK